MRRLILMRHAKSAWDADAMSDHDRPLNGRGRKDAARMAKALVERGFVPDAVVSSDAVRTRETWACMVERFPGVAAAFTPHLYHAGMGALRIVLSACDPGARTVLALGHNPGWEAALAWLCGEHHALTTANCALLEGEGATWEEAIARPGSWRLVGVLRPKEL